mmetsp:Transcript_12270/g.16022  ORF Transcript_12270/g.16022 Transcript_12270/m.16022 type:complete len:116 (-) Transcript_12270:2970-3317(-)
MKSIVSLMFTILCLAMVHAYDRESLNKIMERDVLPSRAEILQGRHHSGGLGNNRRKRNGRLRGVKGLKGRYGEAESLGEVSSVTNHRDIYEFARKLDNISDPTQRRQMIMEQKKK